MLNAAGQTRDRAASLRSGGDLLLCAFESLLALQGALADEWRQDIGEFSSQEILGMSSLLSNHIRRTSFINYEETLACSCYNTWPLPRSPHSLSQLSPQTRPQGPLQFRDGVQQSRKGLEAPQSGSDGFAEHCGQRHVGCMIARS